MRRSERRGADELRPMFDDLLWRRRGRPGAAIEAFLAPASGKVKTAIPGPGGILGAGPAAPPAKASPCRTSAGRTSSKGSLKVNLPDNCVFTFHETQTTSGPVYTQLHGVGAALTYGSGLFTLKVTKTDMLWQFKGMDDASHPGLLSQVTLPNGRTYQATYNSYDFGIATLGASWTANNVAYQEQYLFTADSDNLGSVTLQRAVGTGAWTDVRRVSYGYYANGDLKWAKPENADANVSGGWAETDYQFYRYNSVGDIAFQLGRQAVADLAAIQGIDVETATETQLNGVNWVAYADRAFTYSGSKVNQITLNRGNSTYGVSCEENESLTTDYNEWRYKIATTLPDNVATVLSYYNYAQQPLLRATVDGSNNRWIDYYGYDSANAQLVLHAHPSAVLANYDPTAHESAADLGGETGILQDSAGLVEVFVYDPTSGNLAYAKVQQGRSGTAITRAAYLYTSNSDDNDLTIYPLSQQTVYTDEGGQNGIVTHVSYNSWYSGTNQVQQRTTTLPPVPLSQNGPSDTQGATRVEYFDAYGNLTWLQDERLRVTYHQYDPLTGRTQTIQDVNSLQSGGPESAHGLHGQHPAAALNH